MEETQEKQGIHENKEKRSRSKCTPGIQWMAAQASR